VPLPEMLTAAEELVKIYFHYYYHTIICPNTYAARLKRSPVDENVDFHITQVLQRLRIVRPRLYPARYLLSRDRKWMRPWNRKSVSTRFTTSKSTNRSVRHTVILSGTALASL
jgi:hypothetical protein